MGIFAKCKYCGGDLHYCDECKQAGCKPAGIERAGDRKCAYYLSCGHDGRILTESDASSIIFDERLAQGARIVGGGLKALGKGIGKLFK